jgi:hypothetical protein
MRNNGLQSTCEMKTPVVPAQVGIQGGVTAQTQRNWVPACAGVTVSLLSNKSIFYRQHAVSISFPKVNGLKTLINTARSIL